MGLYGCLSISAIPLLNVVLQMPSGRTEIQAYNALSERINICCLCWEWLCSQVCLREVERHLRTASVPLKEKKKEQLSVGTRYEAELGDRKTRQFLRQYAVYNGGWGWHSRIFGHMQQERRLKRGTIAVRLGLGWDLSCDLFVIWCS